MRASARTAMDAKTLETELAAMHASSWGWALACCARDADQAADVLQHAYEKVLSGRATFEGRAQLKTWFFGVVRLTAREHRRWLFFRKREIAMAEVPDAPASSGPAVDRETALALSRALAEVSERQREVLHLVFYEGLTIADAAAVMRVSLGSARQHYERGKASLRAILAREGVTFR
jgi:RNA polymerase sigma-70 factor (ECF subfamily)